jgi:hypothetical protein
MLVSEESFQKIMRCRDRIPKTSFGAAIDLATTYEDKVQGFVVTAGSGTMTVTYKTKGSGATARTETVALNIPVLCQVTSIDSVSGVTELVVLIGG